MKLEAAAKAGMEQAITFEFSHFMIPSPPYLQAGHPGQQVYGIHSTTF